MPSAKDTVIQQFRNRRIVGLSFLPNTGYRLPRVPAKENRDFMRLHRPLLHAKNCAPGRSGQSDKVGRFSVRVRRRTRFKLNGSTTGSLRALAFATPCNATTLRFLGIHTPRTSSLQRGTSWTFWHNGLICRRLTMLNAWDDFVSGG
jgi:hypothetical protein